MLPSRARTESPSCEKACQLAMRPSQQSTHSSSQIPKKPPRPIAQCIEGEDHGTLDVDHVPIEYAPSLHILPITANRRHQNPGAMPWKQRIAQTEQQSHQGGEQDDRRPDPGLWRCG